mgnify:CR=1 FL=1
MDGWGLQGTDEGEGKAGRKEPTRTMTVRRSNNPKKAGKGKGGNANMADNGVILLLAGVNENSSVKVKTEQGDFDFKLADIGYGKFIEKLEGAVDIERVAASRPLASSGADDDYPALSVAPDGTAFAAWLCYTTGMERDDRAERFQTEPPDCSSRAKESGGARLG